VSSSESDAPPPPSAKQLERRASRVKWGEDGERREVGDMLVDSTPRRAADCYKTSTVNRRPSQDTAPWSQNLRDEDPGWLLDNPSSPSQEQRLQRALDETLEGCEDWIWDSSQPDS